jgi:hypothetical protein
MQQGLVQVSATAPSWLIGPAKPIGGMLGWLGLGCCFWPSGGGGETRIGDPSR